MPRKFKPPGIEVDEADDERSFGPISESEIREATGRILHGWSRNDKLRLYEELRIEGGASRVDFALVNGITHAYELKSDVDSLNQLSNQIHAYGRVFDKVTIVVAPKWRHEVENLVPRWWGVIAARRIKFGHLVVLKGVRDAHSNPAQDPYSVASMLWRDEAITLLEENGAPSPKSKATRADLYEQIARDVPMPAIRKFVAKTLYERRPATAAK